MYADTGERMEWINMKLKENFITQDIYDSQYLVPIGGEAFNGMARSNETAAFIVDCLKKETTKEKLLMLFIMNMKHQEMKSPQM